MALATAYYGVNMDTASTWYGNATIANNNQIQITYGSYVQNYYGSFYYNYYGLTGGTVTSTNYYEFDTKIYEITRGSYNALTIEGYLNQGNSYGLFSYVFSGNDSLNGSGQSDILNGFSGNDLILGNGGDDTLKGGEGDDALDGNKGNDYLYGGAGNDILTGGGGSDTLTGGLGNDRYVVSGGTTIYEAAGEGRDTIYSSVSIVNLPSNIEDILLTGSSSLTATGNALANTLTGNNSNNLLKGGLGNDALDGGAGIDTADYSDKTKAVVATLNGSIKTAVTVGGVAEDTIRNIENLTGGSTADTLTGNGLVNTLIGNAGNDVLNGMGGNDILRGGLGKDILSGGVGQDFFRFDTALSTSTNIDRITDFSVVDDTIQLERSIFSKLGSSPRTVDTLYFKAIATGGTTDTNDYIVYNKSTGALYYDANGSTNGLTDAIQITTLGTKLALTHADFSIV